MIDYHFHILFPKMKLIAQKYFPILIKYFFIKNRCYSTSQSFS